MTNNKKMQFATRAIHAGSNDDPSGALTAPIHMTSTFAFDSVEQGAARFAGEEQGHFYTRISNPTQQLLEERMADLEGTEAALATASGMGAITATLWTLLSAGDHIIVDKTLYGCTFAFSEHGLQRFNVAVSYVDLEDAAALKDAMQENTRAVYFETPANQNMRVVDIEQISTISHQYNPDIKVIVDSTYCTPVIQRPTELGADIVIHSATKYLGGHGDLIAGAICGDLETITNIRVVGLKDMTGAAISPFNAFLVLRGLKTLELRVERHCQSAMDIATRLNADKRVTQVSYPGLPTDRYHELAKRQMNGFGGMIAFELNGDIDTAIKFMNNLKMIKRAVSLGDAETLCQHPASMTHSSYTPEERAKHGISETLIRLSVGLEATDDIYADIEQALATA